MDSIVEIDLVTTNSAVASYRDLLARTERMYKELSTDRRRTLSELIDGFEGCSNLVIRK